MKSATLQLNKFQQAQNRHIVTIEHHYNTLWRDWGWKRQMSSRGIRTRDLAIHDDRRFWPRFSGILGALVKWLSSRTYAQVPLLEEVSFFMVWFDPDLPVLHIHLNNTGPTARLTARCYRARINSNFSLVVSWDWFISFKHKNEPGTSGPSQSPIQLKRDSLVAIATKYSCQKK